MPASRDARPTPELALQLARRTFVTGRRVDMGTLATELGVNRATLYRWFGDRENLMGRVLAELSSVTWQIAQAEAEGENGMERGLDEIRRFMTMTSDFGPLVAFAEREPKLALRVLMADGGPVNAELKHRFARAIDENAATGTAPVSPELVEVFVQLATALEWGPIVIGEAPAIERAINLMRSILATRAES